jgi:hypothetical protein
MVEGDATSAAPSPASVVRTVRCSGRVPHRTTATGVAPARPAAMRRSAMAALVATPMRMTTVPPTRATASQSVPVEAQGSSWPVTTVKEVDSPRWVTGTPA